MQKHQIEKCVDVVHGSMVLCGEGDLLTNLEASAQEVGTSWNAPWSLRHWGEPFVQFQATLLISALAGTILEISI